MNVEITELTFPASSTHREIAALGIIAWRREPTASEIEQRARNLEREIKTLNQDEKGIFTARKSGAIVGFVRVTQDKNEPSQWWLIGLVVHPGHRRRGIGKALSEAGIAYARERGATTIRSEAHLDNEVSISFHEHFGFENEGRFTAPDGDEKVAFKLSLTTRAGNCD